MQPSKATDWVLSVGVPKPPIYTAYGFLRGRTIAGRRGAGGRRLVLVEPWTLCAFVCGVRSPRRVNLAPSVI
jgi:hypothetical protein